MVNKVVLLPETSGETQNTLDVLCVSPSFGLSRNLALLAKAPQSIT
jgi:hypothetical protein